MNDIIDRGENDPLDFDLTGWKPVVHGIREVLFSGDRDALDAIAKLLSGNEWDSGTLDDVANIVRSTGRVIRDL
jgi:hypothetical protein